MAIRDNRLVKLGLASESGHTNALIDMLDPAEGENFNRQVFAELAKVKDHPGVVPAIAAHLELDARPSVQNAGLLALAMLGDPRGLPTLRDALRSPVAQIRVQAARTLRRFGGDQTIDALRGALDSPDRNVRWTVVEALGEIQGPRAIAVLVEAMNDESRAIRRRSAETLGRMGGAEAVDALASAVEHADAQVRVMIVHALGRIGTRQAIEVIAEMTRDDDRRVRPYAYRYIRTVKPPAAADIVEAVRDTTFSRLERWRLRRHAARLRMAAARR